MDDKALTDFQREVFAVVRRIPPYGASTYGEVAREAGHSGAARAVGSVLAKNPWAYHACHDEHGYLLDKRYVPCHRVVETGGGLGGFAGSSDPSSRQLRLKEELLEFESLLAPSKDRIVDEPALVAGGIPCA